MGSSCGEDRTRREQILEVALHLFRKQGFEGTPMSQIAEEIGISKAGLYHHFRTKDYVLRALVEPGFDRVEELLGRHRPAPNGSPEQRALLEEYLDLILETPELMALLATDPAVLSRPEVGGRATELNDRMLWLVAGSEAGCGGQIRAAMALGALQVAVIRFLQADPRIVREEGLRAASRLLDDGS